MIIPVLLTATEIDFLTTALEHSVNEGKMPAPVQIFVESLLEKLKQARKAADDVSKEGTQ
jgi:hypothetical protein